MEPSRGTTVVHGQERLRRNCRKTSIQRERIMDIKEWNQLEALLLDTAKRVLGETAGKQAYNEKGSWTLRNGTN